MHLFSKNFSILQPKSFRQMGAWKFLKNLFAKDDPLSKKEFSFSFDFPEKEAQMEKAFKSKIVQDSSKNKYRENEEQLFALAEAIKNAQRYNNAIKAYEALALKYPHKRGYCEKKIGELYLLMDRYEDALSYFIATKIHGPELDVEEEIAKCCVALFENPNVEEAPYHWINQYLFLYPNGKYINRIKNLT